MDRRMFVKKSGLFIPAAIGFPAIVKGDLLGDLAMLARKKDSEVTYTEEQSNTGGGAGRLVSSAFVQSTSINIKAASTYTPTKIEWSLKKNGSPTGPITGYIYHAATPGADTAPDDRDVVADFTLDISTLTTSWLYYAFYFTGAGEWTGGSTYNAAIYYPGGDSGNYLNVEYTGYIGTGWSMWNKTSGEPGVSNDAGNWYAQDTNGGPNHKVSSSP